MNSSKPVLFVGCSSESLPVAEALQDNLSASIDVRIWQGLFRPAKFFLEELEEAARKADFAVFVWAADDVVTIRGSAYSSARDNVVLETGLFLGVLGRERVFILIPSGVAVRLPDDLKGVTFLSYSEPGDGNWTAALGSAARRIRSSISESAAARSSPRPVEAAPTVFSDLESAVPTIREDALRSTGIRILANRGLVFLGTDESVIPFHDAAKFKSLKKLRLILLSPQSRWIHEGLVQLRAYESIDAFRKSLQSGHEVVERVLSRFNDLHGAPVNSGVRYFRGEPTFRLIVTDDAAYVSSYAEHPSHTARSLPVYRFPRAVGSLYAAYKRHFDDLWHNSSSSGTYELQNVELETSAGGIVTVQSGDDIRYLLLQRHDGFWVVPKGHRRADGEDIRQTARREVSEETGIPMESLTINRYLGEYTFDEAAEEAGAKKVVHLFHMTVEPAAVPKARPVDHASVQWFSAAEDLPTMRYSYQKSFLAELLTALGQKTGAPPS